MTMRKVAMGAFLLCMACAANPIQLKAEDTARFNEIAWTVRSIILEKDGKALADHVHRGVYINDGLWKKEEVARKVKDTRSDLYDLLYSGKTSFRQFFLDATDLEVVLDGDGDLRSIYYRSQSSQRTIQPSISVLLKGGMWYITNLEHVSDK